VVRGAADRKRERELFTLFVVIREKRGNPKGRETAFALCPAPRTAGGREREISASSRRRGERARSSLEKKKKNGIGEQTHSRGSFPRFADIDLVVSFVVVSFVDDFISRGGRRKRKSGFLVGGSEKGADDWREKADEERVERKLFGEPSATVYVGGNESAGYDGVR
jgi:hypothetical protein